MNILLANKDGSSNAQVGDYVVTGGGIFEKTATGSRFVQSLKDYIGTEKTSSYDVVRGIYSKVTGKSAQVITAAPAKIDENGIVTVFPVTDPAAASANSATYDPAAYVSGGGSSINGSKIAGYVIIGLVGLAVLDRFVGGSGQAR